MATISAKPLTPVAESALAPYRYTASGAVFVDSDGSTYSNDPSIRVLTAEPVPGKPGLYRWPGEAEEFPLSSPGF